MGDRGKQERSAEQMLRRWRSDDPKRVIGRGHPVGEFLEAHEWEVLERGEGRLSVRARPPERVMNPRGELFGGFTTTFLDFFALHVFHTSRAPDSPVRWLSTASLRMDYFAPITGPSFEMHGEVLNRSGRTGQIETRFVVDGRLCAIGQATLIEQSD
jgi:acyl-coenzyme A thioesterase PaaI-like protein